MIDKLQSWILNRGGVEHDSEELSLLELIAKTAYKTNEIINELDEKIQNGDNFEGSWWGLSKPTLTQEGTSAQVEKNTKDITNLDVKITSEITSMNNRIDSLEQLKIGKYIFIGDSYMSPVVNWVDECSKVLKLNTSQYIKKYYGGAGFACTNEGNNFITLLESIPNDDTVSDIVVCGGANDALQSRASVVSAISTFITTAKLKFPNAKVHVGFVGRVLESANTYSYGECVSTYKECLPMGAHYLEGVEASAHHYLATLTDNVHLTDFGQKQLGVSVANALKYGSVNISYPLAIASTKEGTTIYNNVTNGVCNLFSNGSYICTPNSTPNDYLDVCILSNNYVIGNKYLQAYPVNVYVDNAYKTGNMFLEGNKLRIRLGENVSTTNVVKVAAFNINIPVIFN